MDQEQTDIANDGNVIIKNKDEFLTEIRSAIDKQINAWVKALKKGDTAELAELYTDDAKIMGHGEPSVFGKDKILNMFEGFVRNKITGSEFTTIGIWGNDDLIIEEGTGKFFHENGNIVSRGKYLLVWKKIEGKWKIFRDMYNSDGDINSKQDGN
jgi:uncharacterized protein (TIGR02246 family)